MKKNVIDKASIEKTREILNKANTIYNEKKHSIAADYVIYEFEKLLKEFEIYIPDIDRMDEDRDNESCIYGHAYTKLRNDITNILKKFFK